MLKERINQLTSEIRQEFGYDRGVKPIIRESFEHPDSSIHVVLSDRAEKSLMIGPGGRIVTELSKRIRRKVSFYGEDELILRRHRLKLTKARIEEIFEKANTLQQEFLTLLGELVDKESMYPQHPIEYPESKIADPKVLVAFSGGVDSGMTLILASRYFESVTALVANLGPRFLDPRELERINEFCAKLGVDCKIIHITEKTEHIIEKTVSGAIHPCGECHRLTMQAIKREAISQGGHILLTGELLPTGRQSIEFNDDMMTVHLPASLSLTKYLTKETYSQISKSKDANRFGCHFLAMQHEEGWRTCGPSIFRVLRELQGGILSTGEALELIKSILIPTLKARSQI